MRRSGKVHRFSGSPGHRPLLGKLRRGLRNVLIHNDTSLERFGSLEGDHGLEWCISLKRVTPSEQSHEGRRGKWLTVCWRSLYAR